MKRGPLGPAARARWIQGGDRPTKLNPPAYVIMSFSYKTLPDPADPLTIDTTTLDPFCVKWRYLESDFGIQWLFPWTNLLYSGVVNCIQKVKDDTALCTGVCEQSIAYAGAFPFADSFTLTADKEGFWTQTLGFGTCFQNAGVRAGRWFDYSLQTYFATYQQIRAQGLNPHDTAPVHW